MLKLFLLITGSLSVGLAPYVYGEGRKTFSIALGVYGTLALALLGGGWLMDKMIKIRQSNIVAEKNTGMEVKDIPLQGVQLPPIDIQQSKIMAKENTALSFNYSPGSGPAQMGHTRVEGDEGKVVINPDAGTVIINPAAGSVQFLHRK